MKTEQFIHSIVVGGRTKAGSCSSVYFDGKHIYSYGQHYPLLINVKGKWLLNDSGYSSATGRHISWCRGYKDFTSPISSVEPKAIEVGLVKEVKRLEKKINLLSSRAWKQKKITQDRINELVLTLDFLHQ